MVLYRQVELKNLNPLSYCDEDLSVHVLANVVNNVEDIFAQDVPSDVDGGSLFTTDDRSDNATTLARLSETGPTSGSELGDLVRV